MSAPVAQGYLTSNEIVASILQGKGFGLQASDFGTRAVKIRPRTRSLKPEAYFNVSGGSATAIVQTRRSGRSSWLAASSEEAIREVRILRQEDGRSRPGELPEVPDQVGLII